MRFWRRVSDVDDEVRHYLDEAEADLTANGRSSDAARRAVKLECGTAMTLREEIRSGGWEHAAGTVAADLRYAARGLRAKPGFTAVVALTLAVGIGATAAIFSAANPILFESLPYPGASRIVAIWDQAGDGSTLDVTFGTFRELAQRADTFEWLTALKAWQPAATGAAEPERLEGQRVTAEYFRVLGIRPAAGRDFEASDDRPNGPRVVILSDRLWHRRFGGDRGIIGRDVQLDDLPHTVIGVMPPGFENVLAPLAEIWAPLQYDPALPPDGREWGHHLRVVGRVRDSVGVEQARQQLNAIAETPVPQFPRVPWAALAAGLTVNRLQDDVTGAVRPALLAVIGAVLLVLAIGGVNVANLLLARGAQRRGEFALRAALGASRKRLVGQVLTESLLLAIIGGALGVGVAHLAVRTLAAVNPLQLPRLTALRVDGAVLAFAFAITTLIGLIVGLAPALHASRSDPHGVQQSARTTAGTHRRTRSALVVAEVALAIVLLVSAGLLLRSLQRFFAVDPGFDPSRLLTMQVQVSPRQFRDPAAMHLFFDRVLDAVRPLPGVAAAGFTTQLPLSGDFEKYGAAFESSETDDGDGSVLRYAVSPGYVETMGIPLRRGRLFADRDGIGAPGVALINEAYAKRRFPSRDPIGQRVHLGRTAWPWYTIVGVVGDVKQTSLAVAQSDAVYIPASQWYAPDRVRSLVIRARGDAAALAPAIRQAIWSIDRNQPIVRVATMDGLVTATAAERRFALMLFEAFALAALALAAIGIYGVLAGGVTERVREIGVRSALGASRQDILALILRHGMLLTALGTAIGLAGAVLASRTLATLLFGISPLDPSTYAAVVALLAVVSAAACSIPAWRAARIDPSVTLRAE